jgi:replicative DNA helicase
MIPYPQAVESERAVLGCIMDTPDLLADAAQVLRPEDFHRPENGMVYQLMLSRARDGRDIGMVGLMDAIYHRPDSESFASVASLADAFPAAIRFPAYVEEVRQASVRRRLLGLLHASVERVARDGEDVLPLLEEIVAVGGGLQGAQEGVDAYTAVGETLDEMQRECEPGAKVVLPTGLEELDDLLGGGFRRREMTVLGGRPGSGKTALAMNIARHLVDEGYVVGVASLEMSRTGLMRRVLADVTGIPLDLVTQPKRLEQSEWDRLAEVHADMQAKPLHIVDRKDMSAEQIVAWARSLKLRGLDILVVDHFEEMHFREARKTDNSASAAADALTALWTACDHLDIHLLLVSQLSKDVEKRQEKRPFPADLRSTDKLVQRAQNILMTYRDAVYNPENPVGGPEGMEIIVRKQRNGRNGTAYVRFQGCYQRVRDLDILGEVPHAAK